jgi:uncharacterized membrane protein YeaQ/YmgE (transglycosylase-associated protein family)
MRKLFGLIGASVGGWVGWILGEPISFLAAFLIGMIGTGVGLYLGYRIAARYT